MWEPFKKISFKFFGRWLEPYVSYFDNLKPDLQRANIPLSLMEYVYIMTFVTLLVFVIEFPTLSIITAVIFKSALIAFLLAFTTSAFMTIGVFFMFYTYPAMQAGKRKKDIDSSLPFATTYMATVAASGAPPITMFRVLSTFDEYGEASREAKKIYRDVEVFGMDLVGAMHKTANRTPSAELKELLWGLETVILTGANISNYLHEKSAAFMQDYRRKLKEFSQTLSLIIEIYLTVILVGSIFFIIMSALMSMFGGVEMSLMLSFIQFLIIFIVMPAVSIGFIILLKTLSPSM